MIKVPRMMIYERLMRTAETNALYECIPQRLREIGSSYNWEQHDLVPVDKRIDFPLHGQKSAFLNACKALGIPEKEVLDVKVNDFSVQLDVLLIPLAFINHDETLPTIARLCGYKMHQVYMNAIVHSIKEHGIGKKLAIAIPEAMGMIENYANKWLRTLYHFHMFRMEEDNMFILDKDLTFLSLIHI